MLSLRPNCPECGSNHIVKNGRIHNKKPKYKCQSCGRQFVENPTNKVISSETKDLIDRLLLEKISLAGIARSTGVSQKWLQDYVNNKYASIERTVKVKPKKKVRLNVECDELWSFVDCKENKQWVWLAMDRETREIIGVYIGARSEEGAKQLWNSLPPVYRQCAVCYTDFWAAYACVFPSKRHQPVGKESGKTNHIERFNNTLRQRVSRIVRKTLSFSKKLENHIGAIWYFIHHYNYVLSQ
ncbi:IS1 family transposase [Microcoleus sp. OTE_8_concoct_300]|uniref:IS1 family transposase n=1 Tax=Microcoleus sp. OTE_8_concoct_300 TaxID=2964710 RepID=UPI00403FBB60